MSKQASEEENKELNRVEERLKELSKCELFLDNIFIKDKTARQILVSAYNKLERQQKEIEEKSTIIMAGAEKVKQLEKEIEELKSIASEFTNRNIEQFSIGEFDFKVKHFKDNYIHKDKIKELKEKVEKEMISNPYDFSYMINELLEENNNE